MPNNIKARQKVLLKKEKREDRKCDKFSFKRLGPFTVHAILEKSLLTLAGKLRRTKYIISLLELYLDLEKEENPAGLPIHAKTVV